MMSAASGFLGVRAVLGRAALSSRPKKTKFAAAKASIAPPPPSGGADTSDSKESSAAEDAPRRAKVSMVSLGCPKNTVDGEVMLGDLFANGFDVIDEHEDADAVIINTCGFVEDAKNESVDAILAAAAMKADSEKNGKKQKIIVTGCLAQRYAEDLAEEMSEIDVVMGFEEYKNLPAEIGQSLGVDVLRQDDGGNTVSYTHLTLPTKRIV